MDLGLIFGSGLLFAENMKLKKENEELRKMIAGDAITGDKHNPIRNSPADDKV